RHAGLAVGSAVRVARQAKERSAEEQRKVSLLRSARTAVRTGVRARVFQLVRAHEKLSRFRIGVAPDREFAGRDQVTYRLVVSLRMKEMAPQQRADVFRVRMRLDPGADGVVNLTAFSKGHRIVNHVPQNRVSEREFVGV